MRVEFRVEFRVDSRVEKTDRSDVHHLSPPICSPNLDPEPTCPGDTNNNNNNKKTTIGRGFEGDTTPARGGHH